MADPVDLARSLVRIASENPPGEEAACARFVRDWFADRDVPVDVVDGPDPDRPSVAATVGEGRPRLVLNGHTDVVPAGDPDRWTVDPYGATLEDGRLYGRGSADMKAGLAVAMTAAATLAPAIGEGALPGSLVVHAAAGEETGYPGTESLVEAGHGGDAAIVLEPTDLRVATAAKGVATFRLGVEGRAAHASRPDDARNAIDRLRTALDAVDRYDERLRSRRHELVGRAYATVTEVDAGRGTNLAVVPDRAEFLLDRRLLPGESLETIVEELDELQSSLRDDGIGTDRALIQAYDSAAIDPDHPLAAVLRGHVGRSNAAPTAPFGLEAATDARVFVAAGTPAVVWGPGSLERAHTVDEWVDLEAIERAETILERAVRDLLTGGLDGA